MQNKRTKYCAIFKKNTKNAKNFILYGVFRILGHLMMPNAPVELQLDVEWWEKWSVVVWDGRGVMLTAWDGVGRRRKCPECLDIARGQCHGCIQACPAVDFT